MDHRTGLLRRVAIRATAEPHRTERNEATMTETLDRLTEVAEGGVDRTR